jgi:hypothetical protein
MGKNLGRCIDPNSHISWLSSGYLVCRFHIDGLSRRLGMGGLAFILTMLAEMALSKFLFGQSPARYLEGFGNMAAVLGLLGQLAFAFVPAIQLTFRRA